MRVSGSQGYLSKHAYSSDGQLEDDNVAGWFSKGKYCAMKIFTVNATLGEVSKVFFETAAYMAISNARQCGHPGIDCVPSVHDMFRMDSYQGPHVCFALMLHGQSLHHGHACKPEDDDSLSSMHHTIWNAEALYAGNSLDALEPSKLSLG